MKNAGPGLVALIRMTATRRIGSVMRRSDSATKVSNSRFRRAASGSTSEKLTGHTKPAAIPDPIVGAYARAIVAFDKSQHRCHDAVDSPLRSEASRENR